MEAEFLSRIQFALTASFHFIYPPISMGLGLLLVVIGLLYLRTKNPMWRQISFFWVKVYGLVFALGIATGIVQEFAFGMNWANYSRYVGNIFGSLLAAEGIFAFFLEGGFLGLMLFGGNRLGPRMWLLATFLVAFGAHFSALWILMANSWMQTPAGFALQEINGVEVAVMTSFRDVVFTPSFLPRLLHVLVASWIVGATLVLSVSAWYLLKNKNHQDISRATFRVVFPIFAVLSLLQLTVFGAEQALAVSEQQEVKLAAMEGVWNTEPCTPMYVFGWVNVSDQTTTGLALPCVLSFLAHQDFNAAVTGLNDFSPDVWAPVNLVFQVYHFMINLGGLLVVIGLLGAFFLYIRKGKLFETRWLLWVFVLSIVVSEFATLSGWWTAEFGRQPWIVWNLLLTSAATSPLLTGADLYFSLGVFVVLYALLFFLFIYLLNEKIQHGPAPLSEVEDAPVHTLPDTFGEMFSRRPRA